MGDDEARQEEQTDADLRRDARQRARSVFVVREGPWRFFDDEEPTEQPAAERPTPLERVPAKKLELASGFILALLLSIMPERTTLTVVAILGVSFGLMLLAIWDDPRFGSTLKNRALSAFLGGALLFAYGVWAWPQPKSNINIIRLDPPQGYRINGNLIVPVTPLPEKQHNGKRPKRPDEKL